MLNRFLKIFFFTSLAVAVLMTSTFLLWSDFSELIYNILRSFTNDRFGITFTIFAPIGLIAICCLFSLLVAIVLKFSTKKKEEESELPKKKSTYFFTYYYIALCFISILVILFSLSKFDFDTSDYVLYENKTITLILLFDACIIEAAILAALLISILTLWKTNRMVAIILSFISLVILGFNFISGEAIYEISSYEDPYKNHYTSYDSSSSYSYDSYSSTDDDYEVFEVEEDYLSFLWDEDDDVNSAFAHFFNYTISSWSSDYPHGILSDFDILEYNLKDDSEESANDDKLFRKIYSYLMENPSEILSTFYSYQNIIHQYIPIEQFHSTGAQALLQYLLVAHDDLYSDDDYSRLQKIHKLMSNIEHEWASEYYDDIKLHINNDYKSTFYDMDGDFYQGGVVWAYSFWARRHAEGTDDVAYEIITSLRDYYSDAEYYSEYEEDGEDYYDEEDGDYDSN